MHNFQLPDPQKTPSVGQSRETLESIVFGRPAQRFDILPPMRSLALDQPAPFHSSDMERKMSLSSGYTSSQSGYTPSRSASPATLYSPGLDRNVASNMSFQQAYAGFDIEASRCAACLENGDHVLVQNGKSCKECGTLAKKHSRIGASRRKRSDRRECLRLSADQEQSKKLNKEMTEAARRLKHTEAIGTMQEQLMEIHPNMPQDAAGGPWKLLKKNNMSKDCIKTLLYNKEYVFGTQIRVNCDTQHLLKETVQAVSALQADACSVLQSRDPVAMEALLRRIVQEDLAQRITQSANSRGTNRFMRPSQFGHHSSRL